MMLTCAQAVRADTPSTMPADSRIHWPSTTIDGIVQGVVRIPPNPARAADGSIATVVYLKGLAISRLGQEADETILRDLLAAGDLVLILDYAHDSRATSPAINADMLKLRQDIGGKDKTLLTDYKVDLNHLFILIEGFRLKRDVEFATDGSRVLAMDVQYPSQPPHPVPALMEITCDNANRMGTGSLLFCRDTLLDGGMAAGFAVAMIDHPAPPPYKGIDDPMPQCIHRLKAAVRTLRSMSGELHLNGQIGAIGFSRGGPMAALLAVTGDRPDLEGDGLHREMSSRVQAALIHGNRYDYSKLSEKDPMYKRFEKAWGPYDANRQKWEAHGPAAYLTKDAAPMFLNTSNAESQEYRDGLSQFDQALTAAGVEHQYQVDEDGRGHRVTTDPATLKRIYDFFQKHLTK
jgi:dienelactone hydrolase